jgi:argininosuccinate lyase
VWSVSGTESHQLWGGRFGAAPADALRALNNSIGTDYRLWPFDIRLSQAWAEGLAVAGIFSSGDAATVIAGLDQVAAQLAARPAELRAGDEDVHTLIDRLLHDLVGEPASRLHTGRSRNDQVATGARLWVMDACPRLQRAIGELQHVIVSHAEQLFAEGALMPAYTHLQRAQPVYAAHWMLSHFWALERDVERLGDVATRASVLPLGSGAIAGTAFAVPRELLRERLGFARISENSIDATGDRDFIADALFAGAMLATHISRLSEDVILYATSEYGFIRLGDAFSTGSSMMPQKRNPDVFEIARGAPARVSSDLQALLGALKGLPSGYNKDLQDDKRALFDAFDTLGLVLPAVCGAFAECRFDTGRMRAALSSGLMATDLADYLVDRGVPFREAHKVVGGLIRESELRGTELGALPLDVIRASHPEFGLDAGDALVPEASVGRRTVPGSTGTAAVRVQLESARAKLSAR